MKRSLFARDKSTSTTDLITADGIHVSLPRTKVDGHWATDFSGCDPCPRCGGHACKPGCGCGEMAERAGELRGGVLVIYHVTAVGIWFSSVAACGCVFGAWRHQGLEYADRLPDIPPGLNGRDWVRLYLVAAPGDSYTDAVDKLGDLCKPEDAERITQAIIDWMRTDPPAYDPDTKQPRRKPETPRSRYEREPVSTQEILAGMPPPRQKDE